MADDRLLPPGTLFADYRIERVLGRGGMGTVYLARHPRLPRFEALKVLSLDSADDAEYRARFGREAELAARLDHPNIVAVRDRGETDGYLWIAMQYVDGSDAATLIRLHPRGVPPRQALHIVEQAARGLDEAHRAGMLHRDVKPANLLLEPRPDQPDRVYVSDFGIARTVARATPLTVVGSVMATVSYASPEQLSSVTVDPRADVYALGATLYELLTGAKPFPRSNIAAVMQAHLMEPPPRPSAMNPALPPALDEVIARAMAKRPGDRYLSCGELARAAAHAFESNGTPAQSTSAATIRLRPRRLPTVRRRGRPTAGREPYTAARTSNTRPWYRRRLVMAGAAVIAAALVLTTILVVNRDPSGSEPSTAPATSSPGTSTPAPSSGSPLAWGDYQFVVQAFPALLPPAPIATGYQGLRCHPINSDGDRIALTEPVGALAGLECEGNRNPLSLITVGCRANRRPRDLPTTAGEDVTVSRIQPWERASNRGQMRVSDAEAPGGGPEGFLQIQFDDPARNFCVLVAWGGTSGDDLLDRWWRDAPL